MPTRVSAGAAVLLLAAAPAFAQEWYEPNPSFAHLSADDAYARTSARSLRTAGMLAVAIHLDDAGRVLVAGVSGNAPRVARLDADGRLDPTFGDGGIAELPVRGVVAPGGLEIDADGRIVVTGCFFEEDPYPSAPDCTRPDYGAARLLADGSLDLGFSGDGLLEVDPTTGLYAFGAVRASGGDGAVLVAAKKPMTLYGYHEIVAGLVRIAADGTIDATYGGGFAYISQGQSVSYFASRADFVSDLDVDTAGRAFVVLHALDAGYFTVQRFDAAGGPDWAFGDTGEPGLYFVPGASSVNFSASQVALDGAGRAVVVAGPGLLRLLEDGTPDPTFSGDGFAWNHAASVLGLTKAQLRETCAFPLADDDPDADPLCDGGFLAVATSADRWALAKLVRYRDAKGRVIARGIDVRAIDPADPGAIVWTTYRSPDPRFSNVAGLAITPDGAAAYALGDTFVLRVDLAARKPLPLPDLRAQWIGSVRAIDRGGGRYELSAHVRIRNFSRRDAETAIAVVDSDDGTIDVPLVPDTSGASSVPFRVRARSTVVRRFTWAGGVSSTNLAGVRLGIQVSCELPDPNFADNTATSPPITPLYAPR